MESPESPRTPAMSMAGRKSSVSFGLRRDSFRASPLEAGTLDAESGPVFTVLEYSELSDLIPNVIVTTNPEDPELVGYPGKVVDTIVTTSTSMHAQLESFLSEAKDQVEAMTIDVKTKEGLDTVVSKNSQQAVSDAFFNAIKAKSSEILNSAVEDYMNDFVIPLHAECLRDEKDAAVAKVCVLIKQAAHQGIHGVIETKEPDEKSPSKIHFETAVKDLQVRYEKTIKMEKLHAIEMTKMDESNTRLETAETDDQKDTFLREVEARFKRAKELKVIIEHNYASIFERLAVFYPDVSGSASSSEKKKSHALHEYKLPPNILTGKMDTSKASEVVGGLLQICQAWLEDFWVLIPILVLMQQNEDKFIPIEPVSIAEACEDEHYGPIMGALYERQMGKLWAMVARCNTDVIGLSMDKVGDVNLFKEIKTGGNGEPVRRSTVEIKNIISFVAYVNHYHEQELNDRRRQMTAVMKSAYTMFSEGGILKACDKLQKHWQAAIELRVKVDWYSLIFLGSDILRHRSTDLWDPMTKNWIENEKLKNQYSDDCLPVISQWLAEITSVTRNMTSDNPPKYQSIETKAGVASLNAYSAIFDGSEPVKTANALNINTSDLCEWVCGNVDCSERILKTVKEGYIKRREKKGNTSKKAPDVMHLLCPSCHSNHASGKDIKLSDGSTKVHYQSADPDEIAKKKEANKKRREKKKAAKAAAKKKDEHGETAAPAPAPAPAPTPASQAPEPAPASEESAKSESSLDASAFDISKMTLGDAAKCSQMLKTFAAATMIGLGESTLKEQMAENGDAGNIVDVNEIQVIEGGEKSDSKPSGVFKHIMKAYEKSIAKSVKDDVQSLHTVAAGKSLQTNAGLYTPK